MNDFNIDNKTLNQIKEENKQLIKNFAETNLNHLVDNVMYKFEKNIHFYKGKDPDFEGFSHFYYVMTPEIEDQEKLHKVLARIKREKV